MLTYLFAILFLLFASLCVVLRKTYAIAPQHELERQVAAGNGLAGHLFGAVKYGKSLQALLWIGAIIGNAVGFVLLTSAAPTIVSIIIIGFVLWGSFVGLPRTKINGLEVKLTKMLTPAIVWLLKYLDRPLQKIVALSDRYTRKQHSGLYELTDLLNLLDLQVSQSDSRITHEEIQLIRQVIRFNDRTVNDLLVPRLHVKAVSVGDAIGPVLLDELHASGQTSFPVKKSLRSSEIIGVLHIGDVGIHSTGTVENYYLKSLQYVHSADTLAAALHIFYTTKQQICLVLDADEEYVGIITLESILHSFTV